VGTGFSLFGRAQLVAGDRYPHPLNTPSFRTIVIIGRDRTAPRHPFLQAEFDEIHQNDRIPHHNTRLAGHRRAKTE
jgi:hypothetical protein